MGFHRTQLRHHPLGQTEVLPGRLRGGGKGRLEVSDTGPGISPDDQPHVFDRLWRGADAAQTAGSGIGLAVAAELARAHEGSIDLASEPGGGSRFTLVLPLAAAS